MIPSSALTSVRTAEDKMIQELTVFQKGRQNVTEEFTLLP